ncbi:MAG: hypothetical protein BGO48_00060 [Mucilaginibacter sp. 44-25]|nr:MAG: hypothetical protein BGO48_00060 [Mucilaginibacter sp. 44-25]
MSKIDICLNSLKVNLPDNRGQNPFLCCSAPFLNFSIFYINVYRFRSFNRTGQNSNTDRFLAVYISLCGEHQASHPKKAAVGFEFEQVLISFFNRKILIVKFFLLLSLTIIFVPAMK